MKKIIFLALILIAAVAVNAQKKSGQDVQFSGGLRMALPVGSFHYSHGFGIGAELQAEFKISPTASITGTTGFTNFIGKSVDDYYYDYGYKYQSVGYIPILVGARVYPSKNVFISGKVGYGILTNAGAGGGFNFEPQVGYNADKFQVAFGYNGIVNNGTLGHLGVTALYKFN